MAKGKVLAAVLTVVSIVGVSAYGLLVYRQGVAFDKKFAIYSSAINAELARYRGNADLQLHSTVIDKGFFTRQLEVNLLDKNDVLMKWTGNVVLGLHSTVNMRLDPQSQAVQIAKQLYPKKPMEGKVTVISSLFSDNTELKGEFKTFFFYNVNSKKFTVAEDITYTSFFNNETGLLQSFDIFANDVNIYQNNKLQTQAQTVKASLNPTDLKMDIQGMTVMNPNFNNAESVFAQKTTVDIHRQTESQTKEIITFNMTGDDIKLDKKPVLDHFKVDGQFDINLAGVQLLSAQHVHWLEDVSAKFMDHVKKFELNVSITNKNKSSTLSFTSPNLSEGKDTRLKIVFHPISVKPFLTDEEYQSFIQDLNKQSFKQSQDADGDTIYTFDQNAKALLQGSF